jgi:flagellar P-ring protein precursor FlgI
MLRPILVLLLLGYGLGPSWAQDSTAAGGQVADSGMQAGVRIKELARLAGAKANALVGYGLVTGLAGTGDSSRSAATTQSIHNILLRFGINVPVDTVRSRNSAGVMITSTLPPYTQPGDKLDVNVTSLGDARSLLGGTLLLTHLAGPDGQVYALAQGPISVGGFSYDLNGNLVQKNHPTAGSLPGGATVERAIGTQMMDASGVIQYVLYNPDLATANRIAESVNALLGARRAQALDAARVRITLPGQSHDNLVAALTRIEETRVVPDYPARVVINERTGTVVSGGDVRISPITITHGDLNVTISTEFIVSQPSFVFRTGPGVRTVVVPDTTIEVEEEELVGVNLPNSSSVAELVTALNQVKATSRDVITILQSIRAAGALHAELIIQ